MSMGMNIFMAAIFFPILLIIYFILKNTSKPKKNLIISVTLPLEAREDEDVLAICESFCKHLGLCTLILMAMFVGAFFTSLMEYMSIAMTFYLLWLTIVIIVPHIIFAVYHNKLKKLKREKGWVPDTAGNVLLETKVSASPVKALNPWLFFLPVAMSFVPVIHSLMVETSQVFVLTYILNALVVASFYLFYRLLFRQRPDVIDDDASLSMALTRVRRYNWGKAWIALAWFTGAFNLFFWLLISSSMGIVICTAVFTAAAIIFPLHAEFSTRKAQERLTKDCGATLYVDDDDYWLAGLFYYNPNDDHLMIINRIGINMTMNLAKPAGKAIMVFAAVTILAMPFIGLFMIPLEFTPVRIEVTDTVVVARQTNSYEIALSDVREIELLEMLPRATREAGTAMDTIYKGRWRVQGIGSSTLCLNPQVPPFILIKTNNANFIFGAYSEAATLEAYNLLSARVGR